MASVNLHKIKAVYSKAMFLLGILLIWGCGRTVETVSTEDTVSLQPAETEEIEGDNEQETEKDTESLRPDIIEEEEAGNLQLEEKREEQERPKVRGIFVTGPMAGTDNMENLIDLVDRTELNAMVIDIKNDEGRVTYDMEISTVQDTGSCRRYIRDMETLIKKCKEKDIYLIARIVAFKDPYMEQAKPEWCIHNKDGSLFKDKDGMTWLDPYNKQVWEYLLDISAEALDIGFDEIQFDYMRFSTDTGMENVDFVQTEEEDRRQVITDFVKFASEKIHELGGAISADVYGVVIDSERDQKIVGQDYVELSKYLDYISPMVYPSHYGPYNYNIPVPDAEPYRLVLTAMQASRKVMAGVDAAQDVNNSESGNLDAESTVTANTVSGNMQTEDMAESEEEEKYLMEELAALEPIDGVKAQVRPWLQDFTATWVKGHISYGADEIRAQIQGVYDAGYEEWILWNASNRYTEEGLMKDE